MPEPAGKYSVVLRDSPFFTNCYRRAYHVSLAQKPDEKAGFSSLRGIGGLPEVKNKKNQKGFTLIELALIIAVLGILGAVGAVKLTSMTDEANKAASKTVAANVRSALAIALAKSTTGKVGVTDLQPYLENATVDGSTIKMEGYTITFAGTPSTEITGVGTVTK